MFELVRRVRWVGRERQKIRACASIARVLAMALIFRLERHRVLCVQRPELEGARQECSQCRSTGSRHSRCALSWRRARFGRLHL